MSEIQSNIFVPDDDGLSDEQRQIYAYWCQFVMQQAQGTVGVEYHNHHPLWLDVHFKVRLPFGDDGRAKTSAVSVGLAVKGCVSNVPTGG